jgi:hypothetical protein
MWDSKSIAKVSIVRRRAVEGFSVAKALHWLKVRRIPMGFEFVYGVGALVLLTALIFGVLQYRYRDRRAVRLGGEIARERYKRNET